jgi:hypothetical protein
MTPYEKVSAQNRASVVQPPAKYTTDALGDLESPIKIPSGGSLPPSAKRGGKNEDC